MLVALIYFMVFHWGRFLSDFWPLDRSIVGPNLVASIVQYAFLAILLVLLYPPLRKAVEKFATRHVESIKQHVTDEHKKLHDKLDIMHAKQNHIIRHSGIPKVVPGIPDEHQP